MTIDLGQTRWLLFEQSGTSIPGAFLVVLVGTTLELLSERSRQGWKIQRWRHRVRNHTIVIGYGTKGKRAVAARVSDEAAQGEIVGRAFDEAAPEPRCRRPERHEVTSPFCRRTLRWWLTAAGHSASCGWT